MRRRQSVLALVFLLLAACGSSTESRRDDLPKGNAHLVIDDVEMFIPIAWNAGRPWDSRPWPNGLQIGSGGWAHFTPLLGPLQGADAGKIYRETSSGKFPPRPKYPDPFFFLTVTFEFPEPPLRKSWLGSHREKMFFPFSLDRLTYSYQGLSEDIERPYVELMDGIAPDSGKDVGDGWRELRRPFAKSEILIRFDADDWRAHGGPLPRRLAASFGPPFWSHFVTFDQPRWTATFDTQNLPIDQWRSRHEIADELLLWLLTSPEKRDPTRRFRWWSDLRFRPTK